MSRNPLMRLEAARIPRRKNREIGQKRFSAETAGRKYLQFVKSDGMNYLGVNARKSASTMLLFVS
jgi:hypothetical protein